MKRVFKLFAITLSILMCISIFGCKNVKFTEEDLVTVNFYCFNDLHGNFLDERNFDGGASLSVTKGFLDMYRQSKENMVILSTGDMWQGVVESNNTRGKIITDWMNLAGFQSMTVGNHEFDWGIDAIVENAQIAEFPILGINIFEKATDTRPDVFSPSVLYDAGEVTIGIIGAIGDCYSSISYSQVSDYYFKVGDELTQLVKEESQKLTQQGADFIVYTLHDGYTRNNKFNFNDVPTYSQETLQDFYDVSLSNGYVDLVFEAHTHRTYLYKDEYGVFHAQAGSNNEKIASLEVEYNKVTDDVTVKYAKAISTQYLIADSDPQVDALINKYADQIGDVYTVIGTNALTRSSYELEERVAQLYLQAGMEKWGTSYDIFLGGGYLKTRSPYDLKAGEITFKDLHRLFPFDNNIVLCSVSGAKLKSQFVNTKNSDYHSAYSDFGNANKSLIDDNATYYIVVDTYTSDYAPNGLTVIDTYNVNGFYARDLLKTYIENGNYA